MINVIDHALGVHPFDGSVIGGAPPPARYGRVFVSVHDGEGRNVDTVAAQRQRNRVAELVTSFAHYSIAPNEELSDGDVMQHCHWRVEEGSVWGFTEGRLNLSQ